MLVLTNLYNSVFFSLLTVPEYRNPINTIDDLLNSIRDDNYAVITLQNSSYLKEFNVAKPIDRIYYEIGRNINRQVFNTLSMLEMPI